MSKEKQGATEVTLKLIATLCGTGSCPTVYRTDRGTIVVQGPVISAYDAGIEIPDDEMLIEIPAALLDELTGKDRSID
jgi:hypothetical protein